MERINRFADNYTAYLSEKRQDATGPADRRITKNLIRKIINLFPVDEPFKLQKIPV